MSKAKPLLQLIPPGEIFNEEFMKPHRLSQNRLARDLDVSATRVHDIVYGKSAITANIALRLAKYFGTTPQFWLGLQAEFDLRKAQREVGRTIETRVRALEAAE